MRDLRLSHPSRCTTVASMTTPHTIAVLGLGRMGGAIAGRLAAQGWDVVGWTRRGRTRGSVRTTGDANEAVAQADLVLLALFDGPACRQVLDDVRGSLRTDTIVLNTSTVAPAEAGGLARQLGPSYVHAPLLGSVPAAAAGTLQILAAADQNALDRVRPVLETLGTVRRAEDAPTAAALKLIANNSLAGAVLALRDALRQADALGLPRTQTLDVLELGQLGALVARKRHVLLGGPPAATAEFTLGALAKDMALLAAASGAPLRSATGLADARVAPEADIAVAATVPAVEGAVLEPLHAYIRGHATGDPAHFRDAFLPTAHIEGIRDGAFVSWRLDEYCALFPGRPAPDEATRTRRIDAADVHGTVATATMTLSHGADTFLDVFLLVRADGGWRIANKAYHRHA
jgi:3-hydroxyisobutyrate dehydrogenase-like beta-hydroxyacid dehydrogenase